MRIKMALLFALLTLGAIAVAGPATASAAQWTDKGAALKEKGEMRFTGAIQIITGLGGYECNVPIAVATVEPGENGEVTAFSAPECAGNGVFEKCEVEFQEPLVPWALKTKAEIIELQGFALNHIFKGAGCPAEAVSVKFPVVKATPNKLSPIEKVSLFGEGVMEAFGLELEAGLLGLLAVEEPTYGIG